MPGTDTVNPIGNHRPTRHQKRDFVITADLQKHIGLRILEIVGLGTTPVEQVAHLLAIEYVRKTKELNDSSPPVTYASVYVRVYQQILSQLRSQN